MILLSTVVAYLLYGLKTASALYEMDGQIWQIGRSSPNTAVLIVVAKSQHMQPAGVGGFFFFFRDRGRTTLWYNIIMLRATIYDERAYDNNLLLREALQRIAQTCLPATRPAGRGGMGGGYTRPRTPRARKSANARPKKKKNIFFGRA